MQPIARLREVHNTCKQEWLHYGKVLIAKVLSRSIQQWHSRLAALPQEPAGYIPVPSERPRAVWLGTRHRRIPWLDDALILQLEQNHDLLACWGSWFRGPRWGWTVLMLDSDSFYQSRGTFHKARDHAIVTIPNGSNLGRFRKNHRNDSLVCEIPATESRIGSRSRPVRLYALQPAHAGEPAP